VNRGGVFVHDAGGLGTAAAVLAAEFENGDRVLAEGAGEGDAVVDGFDAVVSHNLSLVLLDAECCKQIPSRIERQKKLRRLDLATRAGHPATSAQRSGIDNHSSVDSTIRI
jgi:hypothetical protein